MEERTDINAAREEFLSSATQPVRPSVNLPSAIRRAALISGISLITMVITQIVLSFGVELFVTPFFGKIDEETGLRYLDDTSALYFTVYFIQYFLMFLPPILVVRLASGEKGLFRLFRKKPKDSTRFSSEELEKYRAESAEYKKLKRRMPLEVLLFVPVLLGSAYVMGIVANFIEIAFNMFGLVSPEIFSNDPVTPVGWVFYLLTLSVAAPVCEEMFFRGAVLNLFKPYGAGFAIACQAILFAVFHGTVAQLPYTLVGGLIFGYIAYRYGGILPTLILHAINNFLSVVISSFTPDIIWDTPLYSMIFSAVIYIVFIVGGILIIKLLSKQDKALFKLGGDVPVNQMEGLSCFTVFLTSPAVIGFFCIELGMMLLTMLPMFQV